MKGWNRYKNTNCTQTLSILDFHFQKKTKCKVYTVWTVIFSELSFKNVVIFLALYYFGIRNRVCIGWIAYWVWLGEVPLNSQTFYSPTLKGLKFEKKILLCTQIKNLGEFCKLTNGFESPGYLFFYQLSWLKHFFRWSKFHHFDFDENSSNWGRLT